MLVAIGVDRDGYRRILGVCEGHKEDKTEARIDPWSVTEGGTEHVVRLEKNIVIHELRRQGLSISETARKSGLGRKTVRKYLKRGLEPGQCQKFRVDGYFGWFFPATVGKA